MLPLRCVHKNFGVEVYKGGVIVVNAQYRAACSTGDVSDIQMFNLNLNVRVVCRDISPGLLPDTIYVWNISLL